jgi:hypothetical protein
MRTAFSAKPSDAAFLTPAKFYHLVELAQGVTHDTFTVLDRYIEEIEDSDWLRLAERLQGAVGDVVRKVCDHV